MNENSGTTTLTQVKKWDEREADGIQIVPGHPLPEWFSTG